MRINLRNLAPGRELTVLGTSVPIVMRDHGQSTVLMTLTVRDIDIDYPKADGSAIDTKKVLVPGTYKCALSIAAVRTDPGGVTYDSALAIGGITIATARGSLPDNKKVDRGLTSFTLIVT